jgi:hypothetical protein
MGATQAWEQTLLALRLEYGLPFGAARESESARSRQHHCFFMFSS